MREDEISALTQLSVMFLAYAKKHDDTSGLQSEEVQAMHVDGHALIGMNGLGEAAAFNAAFASAEDRQRWKLGMTFANMLSAAQAKLMAMDGGSYADMSGSIRLFVKEVRDYCAFQLPSKLTSGVLSALRPSDAPTNRAAPTAPGLVIRGAASALAAETWFTDADPGAIHVLLGAATSYHAEQNLCLALARRLQAGLVPGNDVVVYGAKPPCNQCRVVLIAFDGALHHAYGRRLLFDSKAGRTAPGIERIRLTELTIGDDEAPKFQSFWTRWTALRTW